MVDVTKNMPAALQVVPGATGVIFYKGMTQSLADIVTAKALGCTEFYIPFASRYWLPGIVVGTLFSAVTAKEAYERWQQGDSYLEAGGGLLAVGSSSAMAGAVLLASIIEWKPFPKIQTPNLWYVGQLAKGAKIMGAGAGLLFVAADLHEILKDDAVTRKEAGLAVGEAATNLAAIAVAFAPANAIPVGGTIVLFVILVGASVYLGHLREEEREKRILVHHR